MKITEKNFEDIARKAIEKHGNCEEHNYEHFISLGTSAKQLVFISFDNDMGILALKSKTGKVWYMIREVLAPKEQKTKLFLEFADYVLNKLNMERLEVELDKDSRKELKNNLSKVNLRPCALNFYLEWPLFNMETWNGDIMPGKDWKKLRNIKNKFYKEHKVEVKQPKDIDKEELKRIVIEWKKERKADDFAYHREYLHTIDNDFKGFDEVRVLIVDDKPCAITAGWKVPNSDQYYSAFGVLDYSFDRLGEIANLDDLTHLKDKGYKTVNFGGSDDELLDFKKKFKPDSIYNTYTYSIKKIGDIKKTHFSDNLIQFKTIKDIEQCKTLWNKFSPKKSVWDLWEMNYSFSKAYNSAPMFILGIKDNQEIGILHLEQPNDPDECIEFFGGSYPEGRSFHIKDKSLVNKFLAKAKEPYLTCIHSSEKDFVKNIKEDEITYSLNLIKFNTIDEYFQSFKKKHRKNLKYDLRQLERLDYKLVWNNKEDINILAELNKIRFKEDSNFSEPGFKESMINLINEAEKLNILHMLSIKINNRTKGSQIALYYNNIYYVLTGGSNINIKNLGKLLIIEHIKNAYKLKAKKIDFMTTESGWKKLWNLDEEMLYKFER